MLERLSVLYAILLRLALSTTADSPLVAETKVHTVHIIYQNHLDLGYTNSLTKVVNDYFDLFFPQAIETANKLKSEGWNSSYVYTTQPYLISLYLDCPKHLRLLPALELSCPNETEIATFRRAIKQGVFAWHAGAFNAEVEQAEPSLFRYFLSLATSLDEEFGTSHSEVLSQRDVPGLTIATLDLLNKAGVKYVSLGINGGSAGVGVPPISKWRDPTSGSEVVLAYHKHGYPDNPGPTPSQPGGLSRKDCLQIPGLAHVLCWGFKTDNTGSHTLADVFHVERMARAAFPESEVIKASTYDGFFRLLNEKSAATATKSDANDRLSSVRLSLNQKTDDATTLTDHAAGETAGGLLTIGPSLTETLPVVDQEMGDTWIFGIQSDPLKVATYRALARARVSCQAAGVCDGSDGKDLAWHHFSRALIKNFEHTWGFSWLAAGNATSHKNVIFRPLVASEAYNRSENLWQEQRAFNKWAERLLPSTHPLLPFVVNELNQLNELTITPDVNTPPDSNTDTLYTLVDGLELPSEIVHQCTTSNEEEWTLKFSALTGAISHLVHSEGAHNWASTDEPLALLVYQTYDQYTMDQTCKHYSPAGWCSIAKGVDEDAQRMDWMPIVQRISVTTSDLTASGVPNARECKYVVELTFPQETKELYGAPERSVISINMKSSTSEPEKKHDFSPEIDVLVQMEGKRSTRNAESISLVFNLKTPKAQCATVNDGHVKGPSKQLRRSEVTASRNDQSAQWYVNKLGKDIPVVGVFTNGSHNVHGVWEGASLKSSHRATSRRKNRLLPDSHSSSETTIVKIRTLDTSLALPATLSDPYGSVLFNPTTAGLLPEYVTGMAFNLYNNLWDTNYVLYYPFALSRLDMVMAYRFKLEFRSEDST
ncbi:hypothetical protein SARC_05922 [Sphaeroforma arctica JP610]|uniref:Glycoside hydrolase family 38 N-terminal domain-containing protein n=1 Tax=Sphaeroforma arctica JP610 TaxID=667725 RepID=A0A0L0FYY6_9EUKA|nr:hypothetical protein SARC_05922 [Sphaeroforma arctica JP610]KNC81776.1 hypothetical protein SARC_05922 [Sphaeroforma arctica JP610]|eukprot:XP_014155678.1 hypothetical protein SARC_05922 [Sphaeroforma arctica JP610]